MIGVAKNHSVSTFDRMSRMSRKWTVSADRISAQRQREDELHQHDERKAQQLADGAAAPCSRSGSTTRIGSARKKWIMFAVTVTIGRISAGNSTFLIRLPPEISTPDDSVSDEANHVHGSSPQNMNSG